MAPASHIAAAMMGLTHMAPWDLSHIFDEQREAEYVSLAFSKSLISFSGTKIFFWPPGMTVTTDFK